MLLGCFWSALGRFSGSFWAIVGIGGRGMRVGWGSTHAHGGAMPTGRISDPLHKRVEAKGQAKPTARAGPRQKAKGHGQAQGQSAKVFRKERPNTPSRKARCQMFSVREGLRLVVIRF